MDQNNPENIMRFVYYLNREQYGAMPSLFYGPNFLSQPKGIEREKAIYSPKGEEYAIIDYQQKYVYDSREMTLFPRALLLAIFDRNNSRMPKYILLPISAYYITKQ